MREVHGLFDAYDILGKCERIINSREIELQKLDNPIKA